MGNAVTKKMRLLASAGLLFTSVIWGFAFVVVKNSLEFVPSGYMLAFRFTIAVVILAVIFHKKLKYLNKNIVMQGAFLGLLLFLSYLTQTIGCDYTTAGKNAFLTTVYVVIVPFLHWLINRKKPDWYCIVAAILAVIGIGLLSLQGDLTVNFGDFLSLICGFGYALHMVYINRFIGNQDPVLFTTLQLFFAAVFAWLTAPVMDGGFPVAALQKEVIISMLYLGILSTMVAFLLQNTCQKITSPSTTSLLLSLESVFGVVFSMIFLGERMSTRMYAGCLLLFTAVIMAETKFGFLRKRNKE